MEVEIKKQPKKEKETGMTIVIGLTIGKPWIALFSCPRLLECIKIYPRLSKSITTKNLVFKNNIDTIENIDLENNVAYL